MKVLREVDGARGKYSLAFLLNIGAYRGLLHVCMIFGPQFDISAEAVQPQTLVQEVVDLVDLLLLERLLRVVQHVLDVVALARVLEVQEHFLVAELLAA